MRVLQRFSEICSVNVSVPHSVDYLIIAFRQKSAYVLFPVIHHHHLFDSLHV